MKRSSATRSLLNYTEVNVWHRLNFDSVIIKIIETGRWQNTVRNERHILTVFQVKVAINLSILCFNVLTL